VTDIKPHQQRVIEEKAQLDERLAKLAAFRAGIVHGTLPAAERARLSRQHYHMAALSDVLKERIDAFAIANCEHEWASMVNEVITSGVFCTKCFTLASEVPK
jgi:hypothetical protein